MAKKARRRRSASPRTYAQAGKQAPQPQSAAVETVPVPTPAAPGKAQATAKASSQVDLAAEYTYVGLDLRRLFLVAGAMLVVLILLNFLIQ